MKSPRNSPSPITSTRSLIPSTSGNSDDTITIDTETVTITSPPSGNSFNISAPTLTHYSTNTIRVNVTLLDRTLEGYLYRAGTWPP